VYRKMQLKEAARQPFPSTAREVRTIVCSREKGGGQQELGSKGLEELISFSSEKLGCIYGGG
jgi:hypothetical protein